MLLCISYLPCAQAGLSTLLASWAGCWRVIGPVPRRTLDISDIGNSIAYIYARDTYLVDAAQRDKKDAAAQAAAQAAASAQQEQEQAIQLLGYDRYSTSLSLVHRVYILLYRVSTPQPDFP